MCLSIRFSLERFYNFQWPPPELCVWKSNFFRFLFVPQVVNPPFGDCYVQPKDFIGFIYFQILFYLKTPTSLILVPFPRWYFLIAFTSSQFRLVLFLWWYYQSRLKPRNWSRKYVDLCWYRKNIYSGKKLIFYFLRILKKRDYFVLITLRRHFRV